jgi:hypothetical protein
VTRVHDRVRAVLVGALLVSAVAGVSSTSSASAGSASPRIVSPRTDQLVKRGNAKAVVKLPPGTGSFRAWLGSKRITGAFESHGLRRVAHLRGSRLKRGVNSIYVQTDGASGPGYDSTTFIVARRDPRLLRLSLRVGSRAAPVVARATHAHGSELRASLNGSRVRGAFLHRHGQKRVALLGVPEGVRFGENRLVVRAVRRSGSYDVVKRRFGIPRDQPMASAGVDRMMVLGTNIELNAAATRLGTHPPAARPRYRWRIVDSPASTDADSAAAPKASPGALRGERTATPTFTPPGAGSYLIRVHVRAGGAGEASHDTVLVAVRPNDPPIGVPLQTVGPNGLITIDGKAVPHTGTDASAISYDFLDRGTREAPASCSPSLEFTGTVPRTVSGIRTLEQLVRDCSDPQYMLILSSASGIGGDTALAGELSKLLTMIGGSALGDEPTQAQFSVIGIPTAPEGSAFTSFGATPGTRQGRLSGYLQYEGAVDEYGFQFADYPTFDTKSADVPDGEIGMKIGDSLVTDQIAAGACNPEPDRTTPCARFQVVAVDRYDLHVTYHGLFEVNTGYDEATDQAKQNALRQQLSSFGPSDLVFIQSYGRPRATTPAWDGVAQQIQRLGGTRSVFDRLDGSGGYALVGSDCQPPGTLGCNTAFGGSSAAIEMSAVRGGTATLLGEVASRGSREVRLAGLLARNHDDRFDAEPADPKTASTNQLLSVVYGPGEPFPRFTAGEQNANAWITRRLFDNQSITPADLRQQYWLHYGHYEEWNTRSGTLAGLTFAEARPSCGCTEDEFDAVKLQLQKEVRALLFVEGWIGHVQGVLDPTVKDFFDLKSISENIQAAVRPPDTKSAIDPGDMASTMFSLEELLAPELPVATVGNIIFQGMTLFAGDDSGSDGAPLLGEVNERTNQVLNNIFVNYEKTRAGLIDLGKIVVSDYGKLMTVARNVNGGDWAFPDSDAQLRTGINKGFKMWMYSDLMPLVWATYEIPDVNGGNARDLECIVHLEDSEPWVYTPDSTQYLAVVGMKPGTYPKPALSEQTAALGRHGFPADEFAYSPPASLTDPLTAPPSLDASSPNLGVFPSSFYESEFPHDNHECGYR